MQNPTPEQQALLRQLFKEGVAVADIAKHTNIKKGADTVRNWLLELGLNPRDRQKKQSRERNLSNPGKTGSKQPRRPKKDEGTAIEPPIINLFGLPPKKHVSIKDRLKAEGYY
jgi:hypothetical protein